MYLQNHSIKYTELVLQYISFINMLWKLEVFIYKLPVSYSQRFDNKREHRSKSRGYSNGSFKFVIGSKEYMYKSNQLLHWITLTRLD